MPPAALALSFLCALQTPAADPGPRAVALLPDGAVLVGGSDGTVHVHDATTGLWQAEFARHAASVVRLAVDPRGELVAAVGLDGRVALWPLQEKVGSRLTYPGPFETPRAVIRPSPEPWLEPVEVEWASDGSHVVTWSFDWLHGPSPTALQVWSRSGELRWTGPHARFVDLHPTRRCLAAVVDGSVWLGWPGEDLRRLDLAGAYDAVEFSPDGARLAVGGQDHLWLVDTLSGEVTRERRAGDLDPWQIHDWVLRLRWSPDGRHLGAVVGKGLNPAIVDGHDLSTVWAGGLLGGRMWSIFDVAWTPGGQLVTGFGDVRAIDPGTGKARTLVTGAEWRQWVPLPGTGDVLLLAGGALHRIDPDTGALRWVRTDIGP
jgi:WD40 repeat protein